VVVNAYWTDIIDRLRGASAFLWHIAHGLPADMLMGRHVLEAAEQMGLVVFPNYSTRWHFDDKIAQKYLLEAAGAPIVPTNVFFDLHTALAWIDKAQFPKVFKLRRGSGSRNVRLVRTAAEARALARRAFGRGYKPAGAVLDSITAWKITKAKREGRLIDFLRVAPARLRHRLTMNLLMGRERGYVYFQDFMPNNEHDTRVTVIGQRAFAFMRRVRSGDFRASGSGQIIYDRERIDMRCVRTAFDVALRLGTQSLAFDFVYDEQRQPRIVEVSFGYAPGPVHDCNGFWDTELNWHEGALWPEEAILHDLIAGISAGSGQDRA